MFRTACAGHKILIKKWIPAYIIIFWLCLSTAHCEENVRLHKVSHREQALLISLFLQENGLYFDFRSKDNVSFTMSDVEIAHVNLDNSNDHELVVRVNTGAYDGSVGSTFHIWKETGGQWTLLAADAFGEDHEIIVTDRMVNGFKTYRVPTDVNERVFTGEIYSCLKCPLSP